MKRALCILLVVFMLVPLSPTPAQAGCCDDFWGCLGAVVTGGLSCAVQEAIEAINDFVKSIRAARDNGRNEMEAAFSRQREAAKEGARETRDQMQQMLAQLDQAQKDADKAARDLQTIRAAKQQSIGSLTQHSTPPTAASSAIAKGAPSAAAKQGAAGTAHSGGAAASAPPAAPSGAGKAPVAGPVVSGLAAREATSDAMLAGALKLAQSDPMNNAMKTGAQQVAAERDKMRNQKKQAMLQKALQSEEQAAQRIAGLQQLLNSVFLGPLAGMISFFALGDPITLAVSIAIMASQLGNIQKALGEQMNPAVENAARATEEKIAEMERDIQDAAKGRDKARKTVELMQKLERTKLQSDLEALEKHLGIKHVASAFSTGVQSELMTQRVAFKSAAMMAASKEHSRVVVRKLKTDLDAPILIATNFKKPTPPPVAQFQPRVATDLDNHFRGRSPAETVRKRDDLIAEARVYFAKDPKTLEAVEKYLREHAATRGAR